MIKEGFKNRDNEELVEDLQFMLSSIRARQNSLMFYLERFKNLSAKSSLNDFKLIRNQFQQKQKIYTRQVSNILQKYLQFQLGNLYAVKAFWIKLKTVIKVSIQRIITLELPLFQKLQDFYEKALSIAKRSLDLGRSLMAYRDVQDAFSKRTIQALLLAKQIKSPTSFSYSASKIQKNRSQTLFKPQPVVRFTIEDQDLRIFSKGEPLTFFNKNKQKFFKQHLNGLTDIEEITQKEQSNGKTLNRIKNHRRQQLVKFNLMNFIKVEHLGKLKQTSKASQKYIQKINKHVDSYEKNFEGAFDGRYEFSTLLDKKKTIFQNIYSLYDDLFAKNIPNHKMIAKFMFNNSKINQLIYNAYQKKRKTHNKKQKLKEKDKEKIKSTIEKDKEKQAHTGQKKNKQKEKETHKQSHRQIEQKEKTTKSSKHSQMFHLARVNPEFQMGNNKEREMIREKKQSQMTAITSKNYASFKQSQERQEKPNKTEKEKIKQKITKDKKITRSKTAKMKLNSEIPSTNLHVLSHNFIVDKHFLSQQAGMKMIHSKTVTEKLIKAI